MKMKNQILKVLKKTSQLALVLLLAVSIANCSKDDAPAAQSNPPAAAAEQNPLAGFLTASGFNQATTTLTSVNGAERGLSFRPLVDGKMTAIVIKTPFARTGIRVRIWDKTNGNLLRTEGVDIATANVETTKVIEALNLIKDTEYIICFNVNNIYVHEKTNGSDAAYPFTIGDIKVTGYYQGQANDGIPTASVLKFYSGDCSFKFQK